MITLTDAARARLRTLLTSGQTAIKLRTTTKGCSGNAYAMEFVDPGAIHAQDKRFDLGDGLTFVVDTIAQVLVFGMEIDWIEDQMGSRFDFRNPNAKSMCGCGESFHV